MNQYQSLEDYARSRGIDSRTALKYRAPDGELIIGSRRIYLYKVDSCNATSLQRSSQGKVNDNEFTRKLQKELGWRKG